MYKNRGPAYNKKKYARIKWRMKNEPGFAAKMRVKRSSMKRRRWARMSPSERSLKRRAKTLRENYRLNHEDYSRMLHSQNGVCSICKKPETRSIHGKIKVLAVDHCHSSNKIRGLLCQTCNTGLGLFKDDPILLKSAISYLLNSKDAYVKQLSLNLDFV